MRSTTFSFRRLGSWLWALLTLAPALAFAQGAFPNQPVKIVVPWAAGAGIDVQTRAFALAFSEALGTPVIIDNRPGAGSHLGYEVAVKAKPDGYTLFAGTNAQFFHQFMRPQSQIDLRRDMAPITMMFWLPQVLVTSTNAPFKDVRGLIAAAKAQPGKLNYGSGGVGSGSHVLASALATRNELDVVHVPLRSITADLVPSLERGDIHFAFPVTSVAAGQVKQGQVRAIAVTSKARLPQWPEVPTLAELFKDDRYAADSWNGLFAPAGTPPAVIKKLFDAAVVALDSPQHKAAAGRLVTVPVTSRSPEEFASFLQAEATKWKEIVIDSRVKLD